MKRVSIAQLAALPALALVVAALPAGFRAIAQATPEVKPGYSFPIKDKNGVVRTWLKGASAKPISITQPTVVNVEQFRVETFRDDGTPDLTGSAPQCRLDAAGKVATSDGQLTVTQADGQLSLQGEGFRWDHESGRLTISNKLHVTFKAGSLGTAPTIPSSPVKP